MNRPLPESQKEVAIALYQYFQMNAEQLSILLNYNLRTVYNMISRLRKQGWVHDVGLGFLGQNHRAYTLTFEGALQTALLTDQPFQPRLWKNRIMGSERTYYINEFVTQLIAWSSEEKNEGLAEWRGTANAAENYALWDEKSGKRKLRLMPSAAGTYIWRGGERTVFHLEVDTAASIIWRMQDQFLDYGEVLHQLWGEENVKRIHVLVLTANSHRMLRLCRLWRNLVEGALLGKPLPNVWFIMYDEFQAGGPLHGSWTNVKDETATWDEFSRLPPVRGKHAVSWIGKRKRASPFPASIKR